MKDQAELTDQELAARVESLGAELKAVQDWSATTAQPGDCEGRHWRDEDPGKGVPTMKLPASDEANRGEFTYCERHYAEGAGERRGRLTELLKLAVGERDFRALMGRITRFSQVADLMKAARVAIRRERKAGHFGYEKHPQFSEEELANGSKVLRLLRKVRPASSQFLDRGVAVTADLYLGGRAVHERQDYGWRTEEMAEPTVSITALDQNERYKAIARVNLTLTEAERFKNLLVECIEHVRIERSIQELERDMDLKEEEPEE